MSKKNIIKKSGYVEGYENRAILDDSSYSQFMINAIPETSYDINGRLITKDKFQSEYTQKKIAAEENRVKGNIMSNDKVGSQRMGSYYNHNTYEPDFESEKFRYTLEKDDTGIYYFDDPLLASFKINIINESPLFKNVDTFLSDYEDLTEIKNRKALYEEFIKRLNIIFNIGVETSQLQEQPKSYYINKIDGLDIFMKKIMEYKKDKLSIHLQEDVTMGTFYIAELYNNLIYSYKNQRYTIPENLLRFNMEITFQEIRNYVSPKNTESTTTPSHWSDESKSWREPYIDGSITTGVEYKSSKSKYKVTLYDCNFDFSESKILSEHLNQAGIGAPMPTDYSFLTFDIFYKSVKRELLPELIPDSLSLNNRSSFSIADTKFPESVDNNKRYEIETDEETIDDPLDVNFDMDEEDEIPDLPGNIIDNNNRNLNINEFINDQRQGLMQQIGGDLIDTFNIESFGLSIADMLIGENNRRLLMDGINGLTGEGNFELITDTIRNLVTTNVNAWRRETLMELNNFIDGEIYGNRWDEDILDGEGQLNDKNKLKLPVVNRVYDNKVSVFNVETNTYELKEIETPYKPPEQPLDGGWEEEIIGLEGQYKSKPPEQPLDGGWNEEILGLEGQYNYQHPDGVVYEENGPIYKPADGVAYEENGPIYKPADGVVYEENGPIYKPADGVVYEENGPVYKPADGVVYEENGPVYKPADGVVYEENGPIYKPADGVIYEENGPIYKPADGVVYEENGTIYKPADGVVYEEPKTELVKQPDGVVYEEPKTELVKQPDGVVYEENGPIYKPADGVVYEEPNINKNVNLGKVYDENGKRIEIDLGKLYDENGKRINIDLGKLYDENTKKSIEDLGKI